MKKLKSQNEMLKKIGTNSNSKVALSQYKPQAFESSTTNQKAYKGFKLQARPEVQTTKVEAVRSKAMPTHFETSNKKDFVAHALTVS